MDLTTADAETVLSGHVDWVDDEGARRLAEHPLESVATEYPHHGQRIEAPGPETVQPPSDLHPVFYGCYDWHSAVHSHWALVRCLRLFEDHPDREAIVDSIDTRLTADDVQREVEFLEENPGFEKPYGWAWLLHLAAELDRWESDLADRWHAALEPLESHVRERVRKDVLAQERPFRVGTHGNTAFALCCVLDYAHSTGREGMAMEAEATARRLYGDDDSYPLRYEPLGWDFLSPGLTEADLMRRVLDADEFLPWLDDFLPDVESPPHDTVLEPEPVAADDGDEGVALHLVGLNLSRAWCLAGLSDAVPDDHEYAAAVVTGARRHAVAGLEGAFTDDYAGAHWLSSFALYLLSRDAGGIAVR